MTIGESMKWSRIKCGYKVKELVEATGITQTSINNMEANRQVPNILFVVALADAMGISVDEYIGHKVAERN